MKEYLAGTSLKSIESNNGNVIMASSHAEAAIKAFSMRLSGDIIYIRGDGRDTAFRLHKREFAKQINLQ